jgi:hypothetical protein
MNLPWCTRLSLAARIFTLLDYFGRTKHGAALLCDLKPEQFCFDSALNPKLVDLNQIHLNVSLDNAFNGGASCNATAQPGLERDDDENVWAHLNGTHKPQCETKCFASFHRQHPSLLMEEEVCDEKTNTCPGLFRA